MRVSREEKDKTHQRVVKGAARLLRERGIATTSIADVMSKAGHTNGGFYRHFPNKEALVEEALLVAFEERIATLECEIAEGQPAAAAIARYRENYLSSGHVRNPGLGCPMPALAAEIGRSSGALKAAFAEGVARTIAVFKKGKSGSPSAKQAQATREMATMVGALILARASDPETAESILSACR